MSGVLTTVHSPCPSTHALLQYAAKSEANVIVVGDVDTPPSWLSEPCDFLPIDTQVDRFGEIAQSIPSRHYSRKNLGYLQAFESQAEWIFETDDDNFPISNPFLPRDLTISGSVFESETEWLNVYVPFLDATDFNDWSSCPPPWPRGYPLKLVHTWRLESEELVDLSCPIQQGLALGDPDVDALFRMTRSMTFEFVARRPVVLKTSQFAPTNSQTTWWHRSVMRLMYLPSTCSFRVTDILRGFVARYLTRERGMATSYHSAIVKQDRNDHDLIKDFSQEIWLYESSGGLLDSFKTVELGWNSLSEDLQQLYRHLVKVDAISHHEIVSLDLWLEACDRLGLPD